MQTVNDDAPKDQQKEEKEGKPETNEAASPGPQLAASEVAVDAVYCCFPSTNVLCTEVLPIRMHTVIYLFLMSLLYSNILSAENVQK